MLTEFLNRPGDSAASCLPETTPSEDPVLDRARAMAMLCSERRAVAVRLLDLRDICGYADFLVVATASSRPQMRAIMRDIEKGMTRRRYRPLNPGAPYDERWTLLDYGDIVVHLFSREARDFYEVEQIWADAPELDFPLTPGEEDL